MSSLPLTADNENVTIRSRKAKNDEQQEDRQQSPSTTGSQLSDHQSSAALEVSAPEPPDNTPASSDTSNIPKSLHTPGQTDHLKGSAATTSPNSRPVPANQDHATAFPAATKPSVAPLAAGPAEPDAGPALAAAAASSLPARVAGWALDGLARLPGDDARPANHATALRWMLGSVHADDMHADPPIAHAASSAPADTPAPSAQLAAPNAPPTPAPPAPAPSSQAQGDSKPPQPTPAPPAAPAPAAIAPAARQPTPTEPQATAAPTPPLPVPSAVEAVAMGRARVAQLRLQYLDGRQQVVDLAVGVCTIGRGAATDVRVESRNLSRLHAALHVGATAEECAVEDLGSTNRTALFDSDGVPEILEPRHRRRLAGRTAELVFGDVRAVFRFGPDDPTPAPAAPAAAAPPPQLARGDAAGGQAAPPPRTGGPSAVDGAMAPAPASALATATATDGTAPATSRPQQPPPAQAAVAASVAAPGAATAAGVSAAGRSGGDPFSEWPATRTAVDAETAASAAAAAAVADTVFGSGARLAPAGGSGDAFYRGTAAAAYRDSPPDPYAGDRYLRAGGEGGRFGDAADGGRRAGPGPIEYHHGGFSGGAPAAPYYDRYAGGSGYSDAVGWPAASYPAGTGAGAGYNGYDAGRGEGVYGDLRAGPGLAAAVDVDPGVAVAYYAGDATAALRERGTSQARPEGDGAGRGDPRAVAGAGTVLWSAEASGAPPPPAGLRDVAEGGVAAQPAAADGSLPAFATGATASASATAATAAVPTTVSTIPSAPTPAAGLAGVGAVFGRDPGNAGGAAVVVRLVEGGPAEVSKALEPGDALEYVDGVDVRGESIEDIRRRILGTPGTVVRLALRRPGSGGADARKTIHVELRRTPLQQGPSVAGYFAASSSQPPAPMQLVTTIAAIATSSSSTTATTYTSASLAARSAGAYETLPPLVSSEVARLEGLVSALATQPGGLTAQAENAAVALEALADAHTAGGAEFEAEDCRRAAAELRRLVAQKAQAYNQNASANRDAFSSSLSAASESGSQISRWLTDQNKAVRLLAAGQVKEAVEILEQIVTVMQGVDASKQDAKWAAGLGVTLENLAAARRRAGDTAGALDSKRAAADIYLKAYGEGDSRYIRLATTSR